MLFGAALVAMMILRPGGMWPRKREGRGVWPFFLGIGAAAVGRGEVGPRWSLKPRWNEHSPAEGDEVLRVENLTMRFGGLVAVRDFHMTVKEERDDQPHRPEWGGQNNCVQHGDRCPQTHERQDPLLGGDVTASSRIP